MLDVSHLHYYYVPSKLLNPLKPLGFRFRGQMAFAKQNSFALDLAFSAPPDTPKHRDRALDAP